MKSTLVMLAALCACAGSGGCQTVNTAPSPGLGDPYPAPMNDPQISVLSPELQPWIRFQPAYVTQDGKRPMSVEVPARNLTDRQYLIEYRFLFYNDEGVELSPVMSWAFQPLDPKQVVRLKGKALSTEAETYRLEVRWNR